MSPHPNRRRVAIGLGAAALALHGRIASAQTPGSRGAAAVPVEGTNFVRLSQPVAGGAPGKIEVIEFFWYGCRFCNAFEAPLEAWLKQAPADVAFRRVPVWFREQPFTAHQKIYYALEATGQLPALHRRVFYAIHNEQKALAELPETLALVARHGGDAAAFEAAYNAFSVQAKVQQARLLASAYKIDSVPAMGVAGRFYTTGPLAAAGGQAAPAASNERMLAVVDFLLERIRRG